MVRYLTKEPTRCILGNTALGDGDMTSQTCSTIVYLLLLLTSVAVAVSVKADTSSCRDLAERSFSATPDAPTHITATRFVRATADLPSYCDVMGYVAPQVGIRLRLPDDWSGRFHMEGCGTLCGIRAIEKADDPLSRGAAVATTDMGRTAPYPLDENWNGDPEVYPKVMRSGEWAYNNLEQELDFSYRGTHKAVVASKAIIAAYYSSRPERSYWRGCSTGGRQALLLAQRYPWHFDGLIAGAPAGMVPAYINIFWRTLTNFDDDSRVIFGKNQIPLLHQVVMGQCDAQDGLEDGVINNPWSCKPDLSVLSCKGRHASSNCLTGEQIASVERLYEGARNTQGRRLSFGVPKGGELGLLGYIRENAGELGTFEPMAQDRLRYTWFDYDPGPAYDARSFDLDTDYYRLFTKALLQTPDNPDLSKLAAYGGKVIMYQGLNDLLNAEPLIDYFKKAVRVAGGRQDADESMQLYLIPGMNHCRGGPGVDTFDWVTAITQWVEEGRPPGAVTGYRRKDDVSLPGAGSWPIRKSVITKTRPVYPYPNVAQYSGSGDPDDSSNFSPAPVGY